MVSYGAAFATAPDARELVYIIRQCIISPLGITPQYPERGTVFGLMWNNTCDFLIHTLFTFDTATAFFLTLLGSGWPIEYTSSSLKQHKLKNNETEGMIYLTDPAGLRFTTRMPSGGHSIETHNIYLILR